MPILPWLTRTTWALFVPVGVAVADVDKMPGTYSGFMSEATYARLQDTRSPSGQPVRRWIAPDARLGRYTAVWLEPSVFYPTPQPTVQLSRETLAAVCAYLDEAMRREVQGLLRIADAPGSDTLRFRPAITAAAARSEGLKAYQLIPLAFILTLGQTTKRAVLAIEYELRDSRDDRLLAAGMRLGDGAELANLTDPLTLAQLKPAIDAWARDARAFLETVRNGP